MSRAALLVARARAVERFDPSQPRDDHGRWTMLGEAIALLRKGGHDKAARHLEEAQTVVRRPKAERHARYRHDVIDAARIRTEADRLDEQHSARLFPGSRMEDPENRRLNRAQAAQRRAELAPLESRITAHEHFFGTVPDSADHIGTAQAHVDALQATGSAATPKLDFSAAADTMDTALADAYASTRTPSKAVAKVAAAKKAAPAKAAKKAVPKAETGVHPAVEKMLRLGTPPRMTERGPLPGEPKVRAPKQAAPDIKQVEMHLASVGVNSPTSTAEDEARKYIDDLKLSAAQMKQLGKDLGVPSLSTASKAQLRDDIVKVQVTGRVRTRAIGEMYRQPDAAPHPDGLDSMEPTALGKYAREFEVDTNGKPDAEIKAALRAQGVGSPDVEAAKRAAEDAAAPKAPSGPTLAHSEAQVVERIHAATRKLERRPGGWVSLTNLRAETSDIPREQLDRTLIRMSLGGNGMFVVPESNQKMLRQADRDAALSVGNQDRHVMRIEPHVSPEHSVRGIAESDREDAEYRARVAREEADRLGRAATPSRAVAKVTAARKAAPAARAPKAAPDLAARRRDEAVRAGLPEADAARYATTGELPAGWDMRGLRSANAEHLAGQIGGLPDAASISSRLESEDAASLRRLATAVNLPLPKKPPQGGTWTRSALAAFIAANVVRDRGRWSLR